MMYFSLLGIFCFIEMPELSHGEISQANFGIGDFGKEVVMSGLLTFDIDAVSFQKMENPEIVKGRMPVANRIIFSGGGHHLYPNSD